jgi:hypothetical protein
VLDDPEKVRHALGGRRLPSADALDHSAGPPEFTWVEARNARGYEIEFSLNHFASVDFSSSWHGPLLADNRYRVPEWLWEQSPKGQEIYWRAFAHLAGENGVDGSRFEVGQGVVTADSNAFA